MKGRCKTRRRRQVRLEDRAQKKAKDCKGRALETFRLQATLRETVQAFAVELKHSKAFLQPLLATGQGVREAGGLQKPNRS